MPGAGGVPRRKYEASKGPKAADIVRVLRDNSTDGEGDVWEFTQALVLNYLIGAVHGRHWDRLARQLKVDEGRLRDEIRRQAEVIPAVFAHEIDRDDAAELRNRLMPTLEHLCAATVTQLRD